MCILHRNKTVNALDELFALGYERSGSVPSDSETQSDLP